MKKQIISLSLIQSPLYLEYKKSEVVVMFDLYGGIRSHIYDPQIKSFRLFADIKDCGRGKMSGIYAVRPSQSVLSDTHK